MGEIENQISKKMAKLSHFTAKTDITRYYSTLNLIFCVKYMYLSDIHMIIWCEIGAKIYFHPKMAILAIF